MRLSYREELRAQERSGGDDVALVEQPHHFAEGLSEAAHCWVVIARARLLRSVAPEWPPASSS